MIEQKWAIQTYDEVGATYDEAQPLDVLRKEWMERARAAIADGEIEQPTFDMDEWLRAQFLRHVMPERNRRANQLVNDLDVLLDALTEDGTYLDPLLSQVHRLGTGEDRVLRDWTDEDWDVWRVNRLRIAAEVSAAAHDADKLAGRMIDALRARKTARTGDLFLT